MYKSFLFFFITFSYFSRSPKHFVVVLSIENVIFSFPFSSCSLYLLSNFFITDFCKIYIPFYVCESVYFQVPEITRCRFLSSVLYYINDNFQLLTPLELSLFTFFKGMFGPLGILRSHLKKRLWNVRSSLTLM